MKRRWSDHPFFRDYCKLLRDTKATFVLLILCVTTSFATIHSQSVRLSLNLHNASLKEIFEKVKDQDDISFVFNEAHVKNLKEINIQVSDVSLEEIMTICLKDTDLEFEILDDIVVIKKRDLPTTVLPQEERVVSGVVIDEKGETIPGANVIFKEHETGQFTVGTVTDFDGKFELNLPGMAGVLVFSFVGMETKEVNVDKKQLRIVLKSAVSKVGEVVVTGMYELKKESFTGAVATVSGDDLKAIGNNNIVQSLSSLDPSFLIVENNLAGANPNALPTIEVRGQTSLSTEGLRDEFGGDPNQPLFILDGFESTLRAIVDLDMNRVASITILKDAASTAIYGAKAANGVVVVETRRPQQGKLQFSYTGDFRVEIPDLRDYNMMNAAEKLEFERLAGRYSNIDETLNNDITYNDRLAEIARGVDTYWLSVPLQTGFSNGHTIYADGGDESFQYGVSLNYKRTTGVMKGSDRDQWSGNIDLTYRKNKFNITNRLSIRGSEANESPYGNFSTWVDTNPYYRKVDEYGEVTRYLDIYSNEYGNEDIYVHNPLYNANLPFLNVVKSFDIINNTQLRVQLNNSLRITSSLQLKKVYGVEENFVSPLNSVFEDTGVYESGHYSKKDINEISYRVNAMLTWAKLYNKVHSITTNIRVEADQQDNNSYKTVAVGFPVNSPINPAFAFSYKPDDSPDYQTRLYRRNNMLAQVNYAYDKRYLLDVSYRLDGATTFGSDEKYSPFWSTGVGWNIHNEEFLKDKKWLEMLKLRSSIGITGNQSFGSVSSITIYKYIEDMNYFGQGVAMSDLGNPNLQWQNTMNTSIGLDFAALRKFKVTLDYYTKKSDPLIVKLDLPASTGVTNYPDNAGYLLTRGVETRISYTPIMIPDRRTSWIITLMGSHVKAEYGGFGESLNSVNKAQADNNSLRRYKDGYSPDDLWAVKSLGIDPANGLEVFERPGGSYTYNYLDNEEVVVGNSRPDFEGVLSNNLNIKSFSFGCTFRFRFGADVFNRALYNKIENISFNDLQYNQDARALYDRWQSPGDVSSYKKIEISGNNQVLPISSRFVQKEHVLIGESFNVGYRFTGQPWLKRTGMRELKLNLYMNNVFRFTTIKQERGINYPFANSVSFSVNAKF